jgi:hypothetical protein
MKGLNAQALTENPVKQVQNGLNNSEKKQKQHEKFLVILRS